MIRNRTLISGAVLVAFAGLAWRWVVVSPAAAMAKGLAPTIAVDAAKVMTADVPVYLQGLGTVQAYYTVTVTARVDGQLQSVAFTEGQTVMKGQLLAQIDPRPAQALLEQVVATKARDGAQLANARRDLARYQALQPLNLTSRQTYENQQGLVDQLTAQMKIDEAAIDSAHTQLDFTRITSPIAGRTGIRRVDPGNNIRATDTNGIVVVTQIQPISVVFSLPEDTLAELNMAMATGPVPVVAMARGNNTELDHGTVKLIDNVVDPGTGTVKLKATFSNSNRRLWPGQYVTARVLVRTDRGVLTVPLTAVERGPDGPFAYVIKADSTVEVRPLKIAERSGVVAVVTAGLRPDELVVTSNQYRLEPGSHVRRVRADRPAAGVSTGSSAR